jgi:hypothetical protein
MTDSVIKHAYNQNILNQPPVSSITNINLWIAIYSFTDLATALQSLTTTQVLPDFKLWYTKYFGASGLATEYYSQNVTSNATTPVDNNSTIGNQSGSGSAPSLNNTDNST